MSEITQSSEDILGDEQMKERCSAKRHLSASARTIQVQVGMQYLLG